MPHVAPIDTQAITRRRKRDKPLIPINPVAQLLRRREAEDERWGAKRRKFNAMKQIRILIEKF